MNKNFVKMENPYIGKDGKDYYSEEALNEANARFADLPETSRYECFLIDVKKNTESIATVSSQSINENVTYDIVGANFREEEIKRKYGDDIYKRASTALPEKLGCIIREGVCASPLISVEGLITLLEKKGIPSYVDFENMTYHYNANSYDQKERKSK